MMAEGCHYMQSHLCASFTSKMGFTATVGVGLDQLCSGMFLPHIIPAWVCPNATGA